MSTQQIPKLEGVSQDFSLLLRQSRVGLLEFTHPVKAICLAYQLRIRAAHILKCLGTPHFASKISSTFVLKVNKYKNSSYPSLKKHILFLSTALIDTQVLHTGAILRNIEKGYL